MYYNTRSLVTVYSLYVYNNHVRVIELIYSSFFFFSNIVFTFPSEAKKIISTFPSNISLKHDNFSPWKSFNPSGVDRTVDWTVRWLSSTSTLLKITTISLDKNHSSRKKSHENCLRRIYSHKFHTENHSQSLCGQDKLRQRTQESRNNINKFLE